MDDDPTVLNALYRLHEDLPRQGPGSDGATLAAFSRIAELPAKASVLDLGCGSGKQTLALARVIRGSITAVDIHRPFLEHLERAAANRGLADRVVVREGDMGNLRLAESSFDLIWCEGAAYLLGFGDALGKWRALLRPRAYLVLSECSWLTDNPPSLAAEFWNEAYPAMATVPANSLVAGERGYDVIDTITLPVSDWWDEYYGPLSRRIAELREKAESDIALDRVMADSEREMAIFERFHGSYGYVFYILRRRD